MLREITAADFPASRRAGDAPRRGSIKGCSHDSQAYGQRFMLRLHEPTRETLESLSRHFKKSSAEIIRHLITQARPADFPPSWQPAVQAHRASRARRDGRGTKGEASAGRGHWGSSWCGGLSSGAVPSTPARQTTLAWLQLTSGPVRSATATQVTRAHAQASGASAIAQVPRSMPQRRPRAT
jgi:hypothetical protein